MALEEAVVGILRGDATVAGLVSERIFPAPAPHGVTSPFITYQRVSRSGVDHVLNTGLPTFAETALQVDCWAEHETSPSGFQAVRDVATAVIAALDQWGGTVNGVTIRHILFTDLRDLYEEGWRHRQLDFNVWHEE